MSEESASSSPLTVGDPVFIIKNEEKLEGVISYTGKVEFNSALDWIGIRLTGSSVNKGKNDGTVQSKKYFDAPSNCGMFIKSNNVIKRQLTRLEAIKLKRELKGAPLNLPPPSSDESSRRLVRASSSMEDDDASVASMRSTATSASNRNRIEELRKKRMELKTKNKLASPPASSSISGATTTNTSIPSTPAVDTPVKRPSTPRSTSIKKKPEVQQTPTRTPIVRKPRTPSSTSIRSTSSDSLQKTSASTQVTHLKEKINILEAQLSQQTKEHEQKTQVHQQQQAVLQSELQNLQQKYKDLDQDYKLVKENAKSHVESVSNDQLSTLQSQLSEVKAENLVLSQEKQHLQNECNTLTEQYTTLKSNHTMELSKANTTIATLEQETIQSKADITCMTNEIAELKEKLSLRPLDTSNSFKEQAKQQAQVLKYQRTIQDLQNDHVKQEHLFEDLSLEKQQLEEKYEDLWNTFEEYKIDYESVQIELEEVKMELEDVRERAESAEAAVVVGNVNKTGDNKEEVSNVEEVTQALSIQNSRLREAILRLREQTSIEKMELTKQIHAFEKDAQMIASMKEEIAKFTENEEKMKQEVKDLKEMVDQGSAFEQMVEDLSERVLAVEDNNISLQTTIRELEEASELNAEMEEAQAEEIKILMSELQNRETVVLNLEEAIKMQRRRELDFQRTVGNYRASIETLAREKEALLLEIGGHEGAEEGALLASQKALTQAAQSVADAALARKKEANTSFQLIDAQVKSHLAERLEEFLPQEVASAEISAVKGELLLSKIAMKASISLQSISELFATSTKDAMNFLEELGSTIASTDCISISNTVSQKVGSTLHQTKFSNLAIEISSTCMNILSAGQWPELLTIEQSHALGTLAAHRVQSLDSALSELLLLLKVEGALSPHQSNLNEVLQALTSVKDSIQESGLIPDGWEAPGLRIAKSLSLCKFNVHGTVAILSSLIMDESDKMHSAAALLEGLVRKLEAFLTEISTSISSLSSIDLFDEKALGDLESFSTHLSEASSVIFSEADAFVTSQDTVSSDNISSLNNKATSMASSLAKLSTFLRSQGSDKLEFYWLSPESSDAWINVVEAATERSQALGGEDLNFVVRGKKIEEYLSTAVENDTKLTEAEEKIKTMENSIATKSKEIAIQNSRLEELELLLAQSGDITVAKSASPVKAPEEVRSLRQEIDVLNQALEASQSQIDEYEREIRSLKEQKSRGGSSRSNRRTSLDTDFSLSSLGISSPSKSRQETNASSLSLESAFFRPALRDALSDASVWKAKTLSEKVARLPPLLDVSSNIRKDLTSNSRQLNLAFSEVRLAKANIGLVKLDRNAAGPHSQSLLDNERAKVSSAMNRLESIESRTNLAIQAMC